MSVLDINDENGTGPHPIMVMEHVGKGSLAELIKRLMAMRKANESLPEDLRGIEYIPNRTLWKIFLCRMVFLTVAQQETMTS